MTRNTLALLGLILEVGRDYGLRAVRVPYEPPLASWRAAGSGLARRLATAAGLAPWIGLLRWRLRRARSPLPGGQRVRRRRLRWPGWRRLLGLRRHTGRCC